MPLHSLFQAAWYRVLGFGLMRQRLLSVAFGAGALVSWFCIILVLTGERFVALLAVCLIGFERNFLAAAGNGRMDMMAASLETTAIASYLLLRGLRPRKSHFRQPLTRCGQYLDAPMRPALCGIAYLAHPPP